jgi:amino acid transporter
MRRQLDEDSGTSAKEQSMQEKDTGPLQLIKPKLGLWDAVSIIIGIVIGSSIYQTPPTIFQNVAGPWEAMGVWVLCGVLSLVGALCYAELATAYPRSGGDYVYLTRAFGPWVGFLFGWAQLAVILSGSTGAMAFIFGEYAADLFNVAQEGKAGFAAIAAVLAVVALSIVNILGVVLGKVIQNSLTAAKVLGLGGIIIAGFFWSQPDAWTVSKPISGPGFGLAMILVLYAYGGWNDAAFVAADVRDRRDLPKALLLGTAIVTVIYLAVNAAYILGLGFEGARQYRPVAADVLRGPLGEWGSKVMAVLVMISALGAINGLIFTGSRVYSSLGAEHSVFAVLGHWHPTLKTPVWSLLIQGAIAVVMILAVGTDAGRGFIDTIVTSTGAGTVPWKDYFGGFNTLFAGTAPVFWTFFLLTGISLFVLRIKEPEVERPFRLAMPWYPLLPLVFCGMCVFGLYSASTYAKYISLIGIIPLLVGVPLYFLSTRTIVPEDQQSDTAGEPLPATAPAADDEHVKPAPDARIQNPSDQAGGNA